MTQKAERGDDKPERDVVHARERHVGRADHERHEPVAEAADQGRHHHEEHHDEAVAGHEDVEGSAGSRRYCRPGCLQLEPHGDREKAPPTTRP